MIDTSRRSAAVSSLMTQGAEHLKTPIHITPSRASTSAIRAVEKLGGSVFCKYYNDLALRDCLKGRTDRTEAAPVRQTDIGTCHSPFRSSSNSFRLKYGIRHGRTEDISRRRRCRKCRPPSLTNDGENYRTNCLCTKSRSTTDRSRSKLFSTNTRIITLSLLDRQLSRRCLHSVGRDATTS